MRMRSFLLNKLVRDGILPDMQRLGQQVTFRKLSDAEYLQALAAKLVEEAKEFNVDDPAEALKELADLLEVINALTRELGSNKATLQRIQAERKAKRGGFTDKIYVERVDIKDGDSWADYYGKDPEKYPEVTGT
jgi:predicted house-cleaning noncanonical NTP pyrophosphatase (MazG superfamily)